MSHHLVDMDESLEFADAEVTYQMYASTVLPRNSDLWERPEERKLEGQ